MSVSASGEIILAGVRRRTHDLGTGNDIYLSKMTVDGHIVWEHFYNAPIDSSSQEYSYYYVQDVQELADKSILVMGGSFHHDQIVILRVDSNGCLDSYDCTRREIILRDGISSRNEHDYVGGQLKINPNPTAGFLNIELPEICSGQCWVYNLGGIVVDYLVFYQQDRLSLDLTNEVPGIYFLRVSTDSGIITGKILKY
jgi:hypothetical protein